MNKKAYISPELVIEDIELETLILAESEISVHTTDPDDEEQEVINGGGLNNF